MREGGSFEVYRARCGFGGSCTERLVITAHRPIARAVCGDALAVLAQLGDRQSAVAASARLASYIHQRHATDSRIAEL